MTTAMGFFYGLESKMWHGVENMAIAHPNKVRWLSIAAAICTFVKDVIFPLVKCFQSTILAVKKYTEYSKEIDLAAKQELSKIYKSHIGQAVKNLVKIPFSPLIGICEGVYSFICMLSNPLITAKIGAAQADLEAHFASGMTPQDLGLAFAKKAALERFSAHVKSLDAPTEVADAHFMDADAAKDIVLEEVRVKREKYNEYVQAMKDHPVNRKAIETAAEFEIELKSADVDKAKAMHFDLTELPADQAVNLNPVTA